MPEARQRRTQKRTPCLEMGCFEWAVERGRCARHYIEPFHGGMRAQRLPDDWRQRRKRVLIRDNYTCYICGLHDPIRIHQVDHIIPGDNHRMENLGAICDEDHAKKSAAEGNAAKAEQAAQQRDRTIRASRGTPTPW